MTGIPQKLEKVELLHVHFLLEFKKPYRLTQAALLRLRRELRSASSSVLPRQGERFSDLFEPPLSPDPVARRLFQRSGPPFVIHPGTGLPRLFDAGETFDLPILFFGGGVHLLADLAKVFERLGSGGIHRGGGAFDLVAIDGRDPSGGRQRIWSNGQDFSSLSPPIGEARWYLENFSPLADSLRLRFVTPARLLSGGKPIFRADFGRLFPFILRRVTSMLFAHCGMEVLEEPASLIEAARRVRATDSTLSWRDWRTLETEEGGQDLGGIGGSVRLEGEGLAEILWVLHLGSLLNLGKGAAYGAGHYRLL